MTSFGKTIKKLREMADKSGYKIQDVFSVVEQYEAAVEEEQHERRSTSEEREAIVNVLGELHQSGRLSPDLDHKDRAAILKENGIRINQGTMHCAKIQYGRLLRLTYNPNPSRQNGASTYRAV